MHKNKEVLLWYKSVQFCDFLISCLFWKPRGWIEWVTWGVCLIDKHTGILASSSSAIHFPQHKNHNNRNTDLLSYQILLTVEELQPG